MRDDQEHGQDHDAAGTGEHIAVIGMAGRFPGAEDIDAFWRNLTEGRDTLTREPPRPLRPSTGATDDGTGPCFVPARGLLERPEWFDAGYFGYTAEEARLIDPQQRVFLECAVAALEHAGQDPDRHPGAIGVYGGCTETAYAETLRAQREKLPDVTEEDILLGTAPDFLTARTAERLGLRGPAVTVQAACATALAAVHLATQDLLSGECDLALAGGVAVHAPPKDAGYTEDGILARDGVCRPFDAAGDGTVAANGVGVLVLKRLADALADGDRVHAVLRGSAVSNDGSARVGFTAPSVAGQAAAVRTAQLVAGVDAGTITYVETHGTATPLGDPIEITALTEAFREDGDDRGYCAIGSVKSNIGHTDAAAGAAGLIKTVLALEHAAIPPSLHFTRPNPQIDLAASPFRVATALEPWQPRGAVRRAGVSAFGIGGINTHAVLEEPPAPPATGPARPLQLLALSAQTPTALETTARNLAAHLRTHPRLPLADVAWTLQTGRRELPYRAYVVADSAEAASAALAARDGEAERAVARTAALFLPGASASPGPGWLLPAERVFTTAFDACLDAARDPDTTGDPGAAVRAVLGTPRASWPDDPAVRELAVFAREYALQALWRHWTGEPSAVCGTGTGALVAATAAGVVTLRDAVRLVTAAARCADPARTLTELLRGIALRPARTTLLFGGDGTRYDAGTTPDSSRCATAWAEQADTDAARTALAGDGDRAVLTLPAPTATPDAALDALLTGLGRLWAQGLRVDWSAVHDGARRARLPLPGYPFERLPYLVEPVARPAPRAGAARSAAPRGVPEAPAEPRTAPDPNPRTDSDRTGDTLELVLRLFAQALGLPSVDPDDSFFSLGGDSLIAARVLAQVRELLPVDVKVKDLFSASAATDFAGLLDERRAARQQPPKE
ncbi:type I polyketide synthase [Streptomyces sp. JHA26]|uniref:type I polyketide synthase n=1 Tax=Streptomyces sp. JHA26 TaxID=1917143 RepID=UPI0015C53969|nr:beta-ketoacyl synthase N-terminal-like domain-containing protein [Streptomyces sp. JHA26]